MYRPINFIESQGCIFITIGGNTNYANCVFWDFYRDTCLSSVLPSLDLLSIAMMPGFVAPCTIKSMGRVAFPNTRHA